MFENENLGAQFLANPQALQYQILQNITQKLNGTSVPIASGNNAFCTLLDASAGLTSQFVIQENSKFNALYPQRANFASELYPYLSDFDYINFTATPCSLNFKCILDKNWIIKNAVSYNENYSLLRIPSTSTFTLGDRTFGLYYPIEIRVNKSNNLISVYYNIQTPNPLKTYSSNLLQDVGFYTQNGVTYFQFVFEGWQFEVSEKTVTTSMRTGFSETFDYTNQFYAARIFYQNDNDDWVEMSYSLSQMVYDQNTPTAILTVLTDKQELKIDIPQIYFDTNQITNIFKIQIYTTEGYINEPISPENALHMTGDLDTSESQYSAPFLQAPTLMMFPYGTTILMGGSDGQSLMSMKQQIVTGSLYKSVPISQTELTALVANLGFSLYKYIDNITDRIYYATAPMSFTSGDPVPLVVSPVVYTTDSLNGQVSTILPFDNNLYTILPTTVFQYSSETNSSVPLTDSQIESLQGLQTEALVSTINTTVHTRQPFHILLNTSNKYPSAASFDLMNPSLTSLMFLWDNANVSSVLTATQVQISHLANGTGGYNVRVGVSYTAPLSNISTSDQSIFFFTNDKSGRLVYFQCTYLGSTTPTNEVTQSVDVYSATLATNYNISTDGYLCLYLWDTNGNQVDSFINLSQTWYIVGCVAKGAITLSSTDPVYPPNSVPSFISENWIVTSQSSGTLVLGENLSSLINNSVNTTWGAATFETYPSTVYQKYAHDVYLRDSSGNYVTRVNTQTGTVELVLLYSAGQNILSGQNLQVTITETPLTISTTISVSSTIGVLVGSSIRGVGIPVNTTVVSVDEATSSITLSQLPTSVTSGTVLTLPTINASSTTSAASTNDTLTVESTENFLVGMTIVGFGIPQNTTITSVTSSTLTLSQTVNVEENTYVYAFNANGPFQILHNQGDLVLGTNNQPVQLTPPTNVYGVETIQFDARIYEATDNATVTYCQSIPSTLVTAAHQLDTVRDVLLERTQLYYKPLRTLGSALFNIGNNKAVSMPLGMSFTVTYYVTAAIQQNEALCTEIQNLTISTIGSYLTQNRTYSIQEITSLLKTHFENNIISLGVSGFWNNESYQFVSMSDNSVVPCLGYTLKQSLGGGLTLVPSVTVNFELAPTTSITPIPNATSIPTNPAI